MGRDHFSCLMLSKNSTHTTNTYNQGTVNVAVGENVAPRQHTLLQSVCLHLLPGVLILLFTLIVGPIVMRTGLPLLLVEPVGAVCAHPL